MVYKGKQDAMLQDGNMRWERLMYCCDCGILLCTYCYTVTVSMSRNRGSVERRDQSSAGGFFVRLISTKFIEEEIQVDWK